MPKKQSHPTIETAKEKLEKALKAEPTFPRQVAEAIDDLIEARVQYYLDELYEEIRRER